MTPRSVYFMQQT